MRKKTKNTVKELMTISTINAWNTFRVAAQSKSPSFFAEIRAYN